MQREIIDSERDRLLRTVLDINSRVLGIVVGLVSGVGLLAATLWLVVKGGPVIGPHLSLLGQFLPGYSVSYTGSLMGLGYGFVLGYVAGWSVASIYNRLVYLRHR